MGQLEDAVTAYQRSEAAIARAERDAAARIRAAKDARKAARKRLADAIVKAYRSGTRQVDIVRITGYSRERVRMILREGGVTADD